MLFCRRGDRSGPRSEVRTALKLMNDHGSIEFAREFSNGVSAAAREAFEVAFAASHHRTISASSSS